MITTLRDYQNETVEAVFHEWSEVRSTLVVVPTGGGKSAIATEIIKRKLPKRTMFMAHREELIWQARDTIAKFAGLDCGIEMADKYVNNSLFGETPVVCATVQTLNSAFGDRTRMSRFNPADFGLLVIDEAHHGVASSYRNVINYFYQNPELKMLLLSASPDRLDEVALGQICESVAIDIELQDLIQKGWLVPINQEFVHIAGLDMSQVRTTAGDLNGADLAAVMEAESNMQGVASASIGIIGDKKTLAFTASVKQAETLCNIYNRHTPGIAAWVCGATNKDQRRETLQRFKSGQLQIVVNCGVLTEGYDEPGIQVIVMARPTKSRALYSQMIGRATRALPGVVDGLNTDEERCAAIMKSLKPSCLVLDFVGNSGKHKLMTVADVLGGKLSPEVVARAIAKSKSRGGPVNVTEELLAAEAELRAEAEERRLAEEARKRRLVAKVRYTTKAISPFDAFDLQPVQARGWDQGKQLSERQRAFLLKSGINPDSISFSQGKQLLAEMFRRIDQKLASNKQCVLLKRYGYNTKEMTMAEAGKLISALVANHWVKPTTSDDAVASNVPF